MRERTNSHGTPLPGPRAFARGPGGLEGEDKGRSRLSARLWKRIRILELLDQGWKMFAVAEAMGTYPREVRRIGWRYLQGGLEAALGDEARPKPSKMLNDKQQAAIVAMVCSAPPSGRSRWTVVLIAEEAARRGIVARVGRETIRRLLTRHELKPWREKNVVRSETGPRVREADGGRAGNPDKTGE